MLLTALSQIEPQEDAPRKFPWFWRVFGILCIAGSALQILSFVLTVIRIIRNEQQFPNILDDNITALVIGIANLAVNAALVMCFLLLGIRLLLGLRRKTAFLANIMIFIEVAALVCSIMLVGLSVEIVPTLVNIVLLVMLQSYADPTLREERAVQRNLRDLETRERAEEGTLGRDLSGRGFIELNFFNLFWVFIISCVLGLIVEIIYHVAVVDPGVYEDRAGMLYGPFSPIYGVGAVLLTIALNRFYDKNPLIIFLLSALIGGLFEFTASWFFQHAFGIVAWDYSGTFLSIGGRTNGMFMCMWGVLGMVWIKAFLPAILKLVNMIPWNWRYVLTTIFASLMIIDAGLTLVAFDCWYERQAGTMNHANATALEQFCNANYGDEFMANRFQSMSVDPNMAVRIN